MTIAKYLAYSGIALLIMVSCRNSQGPAEEASDLIKITSEQFATDSMQLGNIETMIFESIVKCNGTIIPLPDGMAKVNAPISGMIKTINGYNGQLVGKNQPLIEITGNEVIDIQKNFAEAAANFKRSENEYKRIKSLYEEKVTAEKEFIIAESAYKSAKAEFNGLKLKIEAIGLSASKIENGDFYSSFWVKAPIQGFVSSLTTSIGSFIDPQATLLEITDPDNLQVRLSVFADNISNVKKGQAVRLKPVNSMDLCFATISSIGISVDEDSKSIDCYALFNDKSGAVLIANLFVESEIITSTDTVYALPSDAVTKTATGHVILVMQQQDENNYYFKKVEVKTGRMNKGYTEIPDIPADGKILVRGGYNIVVE